MSSRVLGSSGEGLVKACMLLGERHPHLALELQGRPGDWGDWSKSWGSSELKKGI